jgi:hypothetical protein
MNEIDWTNPGGKPIRQDDFNFLQTGNKEAFAGLLSMLPGFIGNNFYGYILSGCGVYLNNATNTYWNYAGYVALNNFGVTELFYVPSGNLDIATLVGSTLSYQIVDAPSAPDPDVFKNLVARNTHHRRTAVISNTNQAYWQYNAANNFVATVGVALGSTPWINIGDAGQPAYQTGYGGNLRFMKDAEGWVNLEGNVNAAGVVGGQTFTSLVAGYLPDRNIVIPVVKVIAGVASADYLIMYAAGPLQSNLPNVNCAYFIAPGTRFKQVA